MNFLRKRGILFISFCTLFQFAIGNNLNDLDTIHIILSNNKKSGILKQEDIGNLKHVKYIIGYTKHENKGYLAFLFEGNSDNGESVLNIKNIHFTNKKDLANYYKDRGNSFLQRTFFWGYEQTNRGWIRIPMKCRYMGANLKNDYKEGQK